MDVIDALKNFATAKGWKFIHARRDYQNLTSVSDFIFSETEQFGDGETFMFVDPVKRDPRKDGIDYSGNFLILTNSDLDKSYDQKYNDYIKPLLPIVNDELYKTLNCTYDVNKLSTLEAINLFDFNADGLSVSFNLKGY